MKQTLKVQTPVGEFTRTTNTSYTHVVVYTCERSRKSFEEQTAAKARGEQLSGSGVDGRWFKDRGYAVTWHGSEQAAHNAAKAGYKWAAATLVGVYAVQS